MSKKINRVYKSWLRYPGTKDFVEKVVSFQCKRGIRHACTRKDSIKKAIKSLSKKIVEL